MSYVFISYAHETKPTVAMIADGLSVDGYEVWWDDRFRGGDFMASTIDDKIAASKAVVVTWSSYARCSVWVHGEALAALDMGKLVQVGLDTTRLPIPFNALHSIDFSGWNGKNTSKPWIELRRSLGDPTSRILTADAALSTSPGFVIGRSKLAFLAAVVGLILAVTASMFATTQEPAMTIAILLAALSFVVGLIGVVAALAKFAYYDTSPRT
jgi:hypothetical protein